ncbi:DUF134 domain-containing protein [Vibrio sonorensis]|uniref:DUF134 domain-containing protein n=1 Tax=Vibrio sonorensis TaxID=1004316 RepID=UPI0008DAB21E|nr:DUF134 domain-containing protein [Vibrio sonorensis]
MARPKKPRRLCTQTKYSCFKPNGIPMGELDQIELLRDELEALRLCDQDGMSQVEAAKQMQVSRQTFGNIVKTARLKVATSIVKGQALFIQKL